MLSPKKSFSYVTKEEKILWEENKFMKKNLIIFIPKEKFFISNFQYFYNSKADSGDISSKGWLSHTSDYVWEMSSFYHLKYDLLPFLELLTDKVCARLMLIKGFNRSMNFK